MDANGSNQTRLTFNSATDIHSDMSPDGSQITFTSDRDGVFTRNEIYVMDSDGSNQTRLTNNPGSVSGYPDWSPDGSQITFRSDRDGDLEIYVMDADGSNQTKLTNNLDDDVSPRWRPAVDACPNILQEDDFNDNDLDLSKWYVNLNIPQGAASVREIDGHIELINRGHLVTVDEYDPDLVGGLRITGRWTFVDSPFEDFLTILTRSDGQVDPDDPFGRATLGVRFVVFGRGRGGVGSGIVIGQRGGVEVENVSLSLDIAVGDTFEFEVIDDGLNVSFSVQEVGGDGTSGMLSTTALGDIEQDHIVFYNRERVAGNYIGHLDDVVIETLCNDSCPNDPNKTDPGVCGCGTADDDSDFDGTEDCIDGCPFDADKIVPGQCGCGVADTDTDNDGTADCNDGCPSDANKTDPGVCGCGVADDDSDGDGLEDCIDACPLDNPGELDLDGDGCTDTLEDLGDNMEEQSTDQLNDAIDEILCLLAIWCG